MVVVVVVKITPIAFGTFYNILMIYLTNPCRKHWMEDFYHLRSPQRLLPSNGVLLLPRDEGY